MYNLENYDNGFTVTCVRVCIDSVKPEVSGKICGITLEREYEFDNKEKMLKAIYDAYSFIGQPQPILQARSFSENAKTYCSYVGSPIRYHSDREIHENHGTLETYDLVMISRKHAEWQGIWKNVDGEIISSFETMLECAAFI